MDIYIDKTKIQYNIEEIIRYMGAGTLCTESFEYLELRQKIQDEIGSIKEIAIPRYKYIQVDIIKEIAQPMKFKLIGKDILRFLHGANKIYIMVVTIGQEFEAYAKKQKVVNNSLNNLIIDAIGTQIVEECADIVEELIRKEGNASISSRYSPGYGDFPLDAQKDILNMVQANCIGVYCNEASMMFPQKTVTAIVKYAAFNSGCSECKNCINCEFKKME